MPQRGLLSITPYKEIVESSVPEGRALKRMNRTNHKKRKEKGVYYMHKNESNKLTS